MAEKGTSYLCPAPGAMARVSLGNARLGPQGLPSEHTPTEGILHLAAGGLSQPCFRITRESSPETSRASRPRRPARLQSRGPSPARSLPCVTPSERGPLPCWSPRLISVPPPTGSAQEAGRGLPQRPTEGLPGAKPEGEKAGRGRITSPRDLELPGRTSRAGDDQTEASPPAGCRPLPGAKPEGEKAGRARITSPRDLELPGRTSRAGDDQTEASPPAGCRPPRPTAPQSPGPCRCLPNLGARRVAPLAPQAGTRWRTS